MSPPPAAAWLLLGAWIVMTFAVTNAAGGTQRRSLEDGPVRTPSEERSRGRSPSTAASDGARARRSAEEVATPSDD